MDSVVRLVVPITQLIGVILFKWDISQVVILYVAELTYLGIGTIAKILAYKGKIRRNHPADLVISIAARIYSIIVFIVTYGMMVVKVD